MFIPHPVHFFPLDGMVPPGSHHMNYQQQPPRYPPSSNSQEVYVFSTLLANRAAQAVYTGQTDSIISFHRSQSAQREYLSPEQVGIMDTKLCPMSRLDVSPSRYDCVLCAVNFKHACILARFHALSGYMTEILSIKQK